MTIGWMSSCAVKTKTVILVVATSFSASTAWAQSRDRIAPTTPTDLRVTAFTSYSVSLAWTPSTDDSGTLAYRVQASSGHTATVSQPSASFSSHLLAGTSYSFYVYAVDAAGNRSKNSNTVTVTLPADTNAPTAPVLSVAAVTASTVSLEWEASTDDGPYVSYQILVNGSPSVWAGGATSITIQGLAPSTTYAFAMHGRDNWQNWSPISNEVTVTTEPSNPGDTTSPTPPANLTTYGMVFEDGETWLFWTQSMDNEDPQSVIRYEVFVNGRLDHSVVGRDRTITYGDVPGPNTFTIVAVDVAGNRSAPASITTK
jgi:chitodextrinase